MNDRVDKIQDYIDGLLSGEELETFEKQLAQDREMQDLLALHREVYAILQKREDAETEALLSNLKSAETAVRRSDARPLVNLKKWVPVLVAACALVVFAVYYFRNTENIYDLPTMRSEIVRGQEAEQKYEDAVNAFNSKDFLDAHLILSYLVEQDSSNIQYRYYWALTAIGQEDFYLAIDRLSPIAEGESVFADEAKYYLAIAYSKTGQKEKALSLLKEIPADGKLGKRTMKLREALK